VGNSAEQLWGLSASVITIRELVERSEQNELILGPIDWMISALHAASSLKR
jgi:hypothetical protein